jgi:RNA polymerase sigma-70 factor (ECF subfamily)
VRLEDVFREHQRAVYAYFLRVVGDQHKAEELTQETFYRACTAALRYRGDAPVLNWLFGIARRVLMEASRKGLFEYTADITEHDPPAPEPDHAERLDLAVAFSRLPLTDREALMLVDYLGFSPAEAARLVAIEPSAFRMRLFRARQRLRALLQEETS